MLPQARIGTKTTRALCKNVTQRVVSGVSTLTPQYSHFTRQQQQQQQFIAMKRFLSTTTQYYRQHKYHQQQQLQRQYHITTQRQQYHQYAKQQQHQQQQQHAHMTQRRKFNSEAKPEQKPVENAAVNSTEQKAAVQAEAQASKAAADVATELKQQQQQQSDSAAAAAINATSKPLPPPTTTPETATTPKNTAKIETMKDKIAKYFLMLVFGNGALLAALVFVSSRHTFNRYFLEQYRQHYLPRSPYQPLYTYANKEYFQKELTFQITEEPPNDIPVYQLLLHKDLYCLQLYCDELETQIARLVDRAQYFDEKGQADEDSAQEAVQLAQHLMLYLDTVTNDALAFELMANKVFDWEQLAAQAQDEAQKAQMDVAHKKYLNQLESAWCHTTGYRIGMEHLLPLVEKVTTRLSYTEAKYAEKLNAFEFRSQLDTAKKLGLEADLRYPLREYTEMPLREVEVILKNTHYEIEKLTKHYITKDASLKTPGFVNTMERRQKLGALRSSRKPKYIPQEFRKYTTAGDKRREQLKKEVETYAQRLENDKKAQEAELYKREQQIKERFEYLKRRDRIQESYDRVLDKIKQENAATSTQIKTQQNDKKAQKKWDNKKKTNLPSPAEARVVTPEDVEGLIVDIRDKDDADLKALQELLAEQAESERKLATAGVDVEEDIQENVDNSPENLREIAKMEALIKSNQEQNEFKLQGKKIAGFKIVEGGDKNNV